MLHGAFIILLDTLLLTYSFLERVPLRRRIVEDFVLQGHSNLAKEIVASKHVWMPDCQPQGSGLQSAQTHMELKCGGEPSKL